MSQSSQAPQSVGDVDFKQYIDEAIKKGRSVASESFREFQASGRARESDGSSEKLEKPGQAPENSKTDTSA